MTREQFVYAGPS